MHNSSSRSRIPLGSPQSILFCRRWAAILEMCNGTSEFCPELVGEGSLGKDGAYPFVSSWGSSLRLRVWEPEMHASQSYPSGIVSGSMAIASTSFQPPRWTNGDDKCRRKGALDVEAPLFCVRPVIQFRKSIVQFGTSTSSFIQP